MSVILRQLVGTDLFLSMSHHDLRYNKYTDVGRAAVIGALGQQLR